MVVCSICHFCTENQSMPRSISGDLTTMRRSPRRPLILRRRKLPFQQNDAPAAEPQTRPAAESLTRPAADPRRPSGSPPSWGFPDGIRVRDHPFMSDTKVVVIPKTADVQDVIQVLSAKGKEPGNKGPSKFILLSASGPSAGEDGSSAGNPAGQAVETTQRFSNKPVTALKTRRCPMFRIFPFSEFRFPPLTLYVFSLLLLSERRP